MSLHLVVTQVLLAVASFSGLVQAFHDFKIANQTFPGWHEFRYHYSITAPSTDSLVRTHVLSEHSPKSFLMCPKGHVIEKIQISFYVSIGTDGHKWTNSVEYFIPDVDITTVSHTAHQEEGSCISLKECLGYQACVFTFGNEFCK